MPCMRGSLIEESQFIDCTGPAAGRTTVGTTRHSLDVRQDVVGLLLSRFEAVSNAEAATFQGSRRALKPCGAGWQRRQPGSGRTCSQRCATGPLFARQLAEEAMPRSRRHAPTSTPPKHRLGNDHRPSRRWWAPWRSGCTCGLSGWPCQAKRASPSPAPTRTSGPASAGPASRILPGTSWDGPTILLTPLLTRGQRWRSNGGAE